jgi:hypothetical protein
MNMLHELKHLVLPFIVGTAVVGFISAVLSYFIIHLAVVKYRDAA